MSFNYFIPTRVLFGAGQLGHLHEHPLPGRKALIVISAGKSARASGTLARVEAELKAAGVASAVFDQIQPNPTLTNIRDGAARARAEKADFIVGLGGGSSIDAAKSIALMAANPGDYWDYITSGSGRGMPIPHKPLPIVAITTTAGTGTEADPWTVVTKEDTHEKIGFGTPDTFPLLAVVDPELMVSVPPHLTAFQGFDALFHSTEGYIANCATPISDLYALKAIELVGRHLPAAVADGSDIAAREGVALANTLSGMVESTSCCTSEHSLEHALSGHHPSLPHGAGLIMISLAYYRHFAATGACEARLVAMARALGRTDATRGEDFVAALADLQKKCGVEALKMSDYGITREAFPAYVRNARETMGALFAVDPAPLDDAACVAILEHSYR